MKTVDVTFQNLDSSEISLTDVSHYFDSDPTKLVSSLRTDGKTPAAYIADTTTANAQVCVWGGLWVPALACMCAGVCASRALSAGVPQLCICGALSLLLSAIQAFLRSSPAQPHMPSSQPDFQHLPSHLPSLPLPLSGSLPGRDRAPGCPHQAAQPKVV